MRLPSSEVVVRMYVGTNQRRDVDNMLKLICDGLTRVAWKDDSQVDEVSGKRGHDDPANARTEVLIYRLGAKPLRSGSQHPHADEAV